MSSFPVTRLRRFRRTAPLRGLVRETRLSLDQFVMPLFVGLVLGTSRMAYASLVPAIFWHSAVDVVAGTAGPRYLRLKGGGHQESEHLPF